MEKILSRGTEIKVKNIDRNDLIIAFGFESSVPHIAYYYVKSKDNEFAKFVKNIDIIHIRRVK